MDQQLKIRAEIFLLYKFMKCFVYFGETLQSKPLPNYLTAKNYDLETGGAIE